VHTRLVSAGKTAHLHILDARGLQGGNIPLDAESPLTTPHVPASYALIDLFHFEVGERRCNYGLASGILDEFLCRHCVTDSEVSLFVLVDSA
jgi:hypothetical protein